MKKILILIKEFKSVLWFIGKFFSLYVVLNIMYGIYIESQGNKPDVVTAWVGNQVSSILNWSDLETSTKPLTDAPKIALLTGEKVSLNLYEGCNGMNVMILFIVFLISFSGNNKALYWFIPVGFLIIHIFNLLRIIGLYFVAEQLPDYLYFTHKYLFTGFIFLAVFLLWIVWIKKFHKS